MSRFTKIVLIAAVVVLVGAGAAMAQSTHQIYQGKVLHVSGNKLVVQMSDGTAKEFDVQPGFMFDIDGTPTATADLVPGTILTADVTTTQQVHEVQTEQVRNGKVLNRVGQTVIIKLDDGTVKKFSEVPEDIKLTTNGKPITLWDLKPGMNVTATIISTKEETVDERTVMASGTAPSAPARPAPTPVPYTAPAELPSTASQLPLVGLTGLLLIVIGLGIGIIRRF
jgi:hypothetical protein